MALGNRDKVIPPRPVTFQLGKSKRQNITIAYSRDIKGKDEISLMRVDHGRTSFIALPADAIKHVTDALLDMKNEIDYYGLKTSTEIIP